MIAISITTINIPTVLESLTENILHYGHEDDVLIVVTGDLGSPATTPVYIQEMRHKTSVEICWMGTNQQKDFIRDCKLEELDRYIGWKTLGRRNFGDLWALREGADVVVRLDDDNYPLLEHDFVKCHSVHLYDCNTPKAQHHTGPDAWFDPLRLYIGGRVEVPHRGLPHCDLPLSRLAPSWNDAGFTHPAIWINEGLWLGELDVDAYRRIRNPHYCWETPKDAVLLPGEWAPMNSQNTSFHRAIMPAAFLNNHLGRYDDIWCSYICRRIMDQKGVAASFGKPIVNHLQHRSKASVWDDLRDEIMGLKYTPDLIEWLTSWTYQKEDATVSEIAYMMADHLEGAGPRVNERRDVWADIGRGLKAWIATLQKLNLDFPA